MVIKTEQNKTYCGHNMAPISFESVILTRSKIKTLQTRWLLYPFSAISIVSCILCVHTRNCDVTYCIVAPWWWFLFFDVVYNQVMANSGIVFSFIYVYYTSNPPYMSLVSNVATLTGVEKNMNFLFQHVSNSTVVLFKYGLPQN